MIGLNLSLVAPTPPRPWWPSGASFAADFVNQRYMRDSAPASAEAAFSLSRASSKYAVDQAGDWKSFAPNAPAITDLGLSLEGLETYYPTTADLSGMSVGELDTGGSLSNGWSHSTNGYGTLTIDAITSINGLPGFTMTWDITNAGGSSIYPNVRFANPVAAQGETWTAAMWYDVTDNSGDSGVVSRLQLHERQGASYLASAANLTVSAGSTRQSVSAVLANASTDNLWFVISQTLEPGQSLKRSMTISMPTMTKSSILTSPLPTSDAASMTREADAMTLHLPSGSHDITLTYADDTTSFVAAQSGDYAVGSHAKAIKSIVAEPA